MKGVFAGHWHIFDAVENDGIWHCQTGSLIEYPFEMRLCTIGNGGLSISTVGINNPELSSKSVIPEYGNEWVSGMDRDRELVIDLFHR